MWKRPSNWQLLLTIILAPAAAVAADGDMNNVSTNKNRITLGPRFGFNVPGKFTGIGKFPARTAIGPAAAGQNHRYDDGYNNLDISANAGGRTSNWGYNDPGQVNTANNTIEMHSSSVQDGGSTGDLSCDPSYGLEVLYSRELGRLGRLGRGRWGVEAALGYNAVDLQDKRTVSANVRRVTDAYAYAPGTTPPAAPFQGTFAGPNFVLGDAPSRTDSIVAGGATVQGERELEADLFGLRVGPFLELPLAKKLSLYLSGGLAVAGVHSNFRWTESATIDGVGTLTSHAEGTDGDILFGGYLGASLSYMFNDRLSIHGGGQFQTLGQYTHSLGGRKAKLDLSSSIFVSVALGYSF